MAEFVRASIFGTQFEIVSFSLFFNTCMMAILLTASRLQGMRGTGDAKAKAISTA